MKLSHKHILLALFIGYLLLCVFPRIPFSPINVGLDPSWIWGANHLAQSDYIFGHTYGPLGYLLVTLDIGPNLSHAMIFWYTIYALFAALLIYLLFKQKTLLALCLFITAFILLWATMVTSYTNQNIFLLLVAILLCTSITGAHTGTDTGTDKISYIPSFLAGLLAGLCFFMKVNLAVATISMVAIYSLILVITRRKRAWPPILASWSGYLLPAIFLFIIHFKSFGNFALWLKSYIVIASGGGAAMSYGTVQLPLLICGSLEFAFYIIMTIYLLKRKSQLGYVSLIFLASVFFAFKESFYRQDPPHLVYFFLFVPLVLTACILFAKDKKELLGSSGIFLAALILWTIVFPLLIKPANSANIRFTGASSMVIGRTGWSNLSSLTQLEKIRKQVSDQSQANLGKDRLPSEWVSTIGNSTVDVVPWEISYIPANGLKQWEPNPVLQTFIAFTSSLDNWSASHYTGDSSPQYLIADFMSIDGRHPLLDAAASWRNILLNYELVSYDKQANRLLLKRQPDDTHENLAVISHNEARIDQSIWVPSSNKLLYAKFDMQPSLFGRIAGFLYIIPPVNIDLVYSSGRVATWRIIPGTLANGILLNYLPSNSEEWSILFSGSANDRVERFGFSGPGASYYAKNINVTWMEAPYPVEYKEYEDVNPQEIALVGGSTLFCIDRFIDLEPTQHNFTFIIESQESETITISGWAVDQKAGTAAGGMFINIDGQKDLPVLYGIHRPDVAEYFKNSNYAYSGFEASFSTLLLSPGQHVLSLKIVTADKKGYYEPDQKISLKVNP